VKSLHITNTCEASDRLLTLDALRGIAAILVVAYHAFGPDSGFLPGGYFAVDFFFILSGLVIARAYESRLTQGMRFGDFMKARLIRLYPLFALGLILDTVRNLALNAIGKKIEITSSDIAMSFAREIFLFPSSEKFELLFRINPPAWSLFMEISVNAIFAVVLVRLRLTILIGVAAATFTIFTISAILTGTFDLGSTWQTALPGVFRTIFGFIVGIIISRLPSQRPRQSWLVPALAGVLLGAMLLPSSLAREAVCIGILMPALVFFGSKINPPTSLQKISNLLGEASYPMYAIHWPLLFAFQSVGRVLKLPIPLANGLIVVLIVLAGIAASRIFEIPVRRILNKRWGYRQHFTPSLPKPNRH
jgi:peptidoglycan/LPS O-acetylase OafA/YrhL